MQRVTQYLTCDSGHKRTEHPADETIRYSMNGQDWEIDLCTPEVKRFMTQMGPWLEASRKPQSLSRAPRRPAHKPRPRATKVATAARNQEVRAWAKANGHPVSERGRIPGDVVRMYESQSA